MCSGYALARIRPFLGRAMCSGYALARIRPCDCAIGGANTRNAVLCAHMRCAHTHGFADVWANQKGVLRTLCVGIDIGG